jgi:hypothetical protein
MLVNIEVHKTNLNVFNCVEIIEYIISLQWNFGHHPHLCDQCLRQSTYEEKTFTFVQSFGMIVAGGQALETSVL